MQRIVKPKNARSKRALQAREPKLIEDTKTSIFVKSTQTSERVRIALSELHQLRSSAHSIQFSKRNVIHPFEDTSSLQFWSIKNDASLFVIGSDSKKRPDNLTFVRIFDHQVLDLVEVGIMGAMSLKELRGPKASPGLVPLLHFAGSLWDHHDQFKLFKSVLLDFFHGDQIKSIDLVHGLQYVISISAGQLDQEGVSHSILNSINSKDSNQLTTSNITQSSRPKPISIVDGDQDRKDGEEDLPLIHFRTHLVQLLKSGQREPRVELLPHGPSFDFKLRRTRIASDEMMNLALKRPFVKKPMDKNKKVKGNKNVDINEMGDKVGKIHLGKQPLDKLQSRKMKGLKIDKRPRQEDGSGESHSDGEDDGGDDEGGEGRTEASGQVDREDEMGAVTELEGARVGSKRQKT